MLVSLQIRNFALIDAATIEFGEGLNILSGETGSGKSILVQALEVLLGGRGSSDLIRQGEEEAEISGLFATNGEEKSLRRVISRSGKNRAYVNERPVPVATLEEVAEGLVDLASQNEHQILLNSEKHLGLLDAYAGLTEDLQEYRHVLSDYRSVRYEREALEAREREARDKEEFLRFQLRELSEAKIQLGEEEALQTEKSVLKNVVRLGDLCTRGEEALEAGEDSVSERLVRLEKEMRQTAAIDPLFLELSNLLEEGSCQIQEVSRRLRDYAQRLSSDPERLQEMEDRLALISRLKKKHGGSVEALLKNEEEFKRSLGLLDHFQEEIAKVDRRLEDLARRLVEKAKELSKRRQKAARGLSQEVEGELKDLGLPSAKFEFELRRLDRGLFENQGRWFGECGVDGGELLIAPNPGEGLHPLAKIASGGEVSRVFLAIKKVLGETRSTETCVFDEVDVGIGGRVAEVIGRNLSQLAAKKQVVCITHLPQIACYADHHFVIQKKTEQGRTLTRVRLLETEQREQEIARMLGGLRITEQAMAHAREMLRTAHQRHHSHG